MFTLNILLWAGVILESSIKSVQGVARISRLIKVYDPSLDHFDRLWGRSWPEGIRLVNSWGVSVSDNSAYKTSKTPPADISKRVSSLPPRRTYTWKNDDLIITFNMTALANPTCTRLVPPVTWIAGSGSIVRVFLNGQLSTGSAAILATSENLNTVKSPTLTSSNPAAYLGRFIEISVARKRIENTLHCLRTHGFSKEDIYRLLDKGPWVLAFDLTKSLPKLFDDLQQDMCLEPSECVRVTSHCPYLLAQYSRYKGRDVYATVLALLNVGYARDKLKEDMIRFPGLLAAPPDRIRGWAALLESFGVATEPDMFGKLIRKAPFMFYVNPPDVFGKGTTSSAFTEDDVSITASGFPVQEALRILEILQAFQLSPKCIDRIVRSCPYLLLSDSEQVKSRLQFLYNTLIEHPPMLRNIPKQDSSSFRTDNLNSESYAVSEIQLQSFPSITLTRDILRNMTYETSDELFAQNSPHSSSSPFSFSSGIPQASSSVSSSVSSSTSSVSSSVCSRSLSDSEGDVFAREEVTDTDSQPETVLRTTAMLETMLYSFPAVITADTGNMRAVANALRASGLRRTEAVVLLRKFPLTLNRNPVELRGLLEFLRGYCGFKKTDLGPLITRNPALLAPTVTVADLLPKVDYFFKSLGGTLELLRTHPSYLTTSLNEFIRPRAEFLRAVGIDPMSHGLNFLLQASPKELSYAAGVRTEVFSKFCEVYGERWKQQITSNSNGAKESGE